MTDEFPVVIPGGPKNLHNLLGKQVRVTLEHSSLPHTIAEGQLLGYGDGGDVELLGSDGLVYHCWPGLKFEEIPSLS